ncbi:MAG: serpin family protein [Tannerella sp.]|jgi:serpin B|nr:serpin family protein [Tannerella sp.]
MKKTIYLIVSMFVALTACDSDINQGEPEIVKPESNGPEYTFSISVKDSEGKNLLSEPITYAYSAATSYYTKENISLISENDRDDIAFDILKKEGELLMSVTVNTGSIDDGTGIHQMTIRWGNTRTSTFDLFKCETEKNGDKVRCKKIWVNDEMKWESDGSNAPVIMLTKKEYTYRVPDALPISLQYAEKIKSDNAFAFQLFKMTCDEADKKNETNAVVSPLSVNLALSMLLNGADGETKNQMQEALAAKGFTTDQINTYSKELSEALETVDPISTVSIANSIWYASDFTIKDPFIQTNKTYYDAEINSVDFSLKEALDAINGWCSEKTNGKIPKIIDELNPAIRTILINALYFNGYWSEHYEFDTDFTQKEDFHTAGGSTVKADMMHQTNTYLYTHDAYAGYLKIPFGNKAYNMTFILPDEGASMQEVIDNMDKTKWTTSDNMTPTLVRLSLPKFKKECSYQMEKHILPNMGMILPFTENAEYPGISNTPTFISKVIHNTFVEINEYGAEAAAVTAILMDVTGAGEDQPVQPIEFKMNRPFIFSICENSTGTILFIGKIGNVAD